MPKPLTIPIVIADAPRNNADLLYATGFMAPDPIVFIQQGRRKRMVVSPLEWGRACGLAKGRGIEVLTPQHLGLEGAACREVGAWIQAVLKAAGWSELAVPEDFPHGLACRLQKAGLRVEVLARAPFPQRRVKRPDEIACIRESQQAAVIAMRAACAMIAQSREDRAGILYQGRTVLTSEAVRRCIAEALLKQDCHCGETIVACGLQAADPHARGHGALKAHVPIVIDIFPRHQEHGYWGDITRTVVKGDPPNKVKRMFAAVKAAQTAALQEIRAGVACARVHRAAVAVFDRYGFETRRTETGFTGFIHSTGHGVGLAIHEAPSLGGTAGRLRAGDVITVEPGLYYPDTGGVRIEDTVVVTHEGWNSLAPCEKRFVLG